VAAQVLLILTDVPQVQRGFGSLMPESIERMDVSEARRLLKRGEFGSGSMGPKVEAAMRFVRDGDRRAVIAELDQAREALAGTAGTEIVAAPS
jgi:carbamate kinase